MQPEPPKNGSKDPRIARHLMNTSFSPTANPHRFAPLNTSSRARSLLTEDLVKNSLEGVASWLEAATESVDGSGSCHRIVEYCSGGEMQWLYPNSNTGETISAWLDLAELLARPEYIEQATAYATRITSDPIRGIYQGERKEARGLAWYWTDAGTYSGLYAMRLPFHLARIAGLTGGQGMLDLCDEIGRTLRQRQLASGIVSAAWSPETGWIREERVGCRYVYALATFATLHRITGDAAYLDAYERAVGALLAMQNADGSFFQHYEAETALPHATEHSIKPFFFGYVLNAIAEAHDATHDGRLLDVARRLADYLASLYYYRHQAPYCIGREMLSTDHTEANASVYDSANGLLWLYERTGVPTYLDLALKIWYGAWTAQLHAPDRPGWHGAIILGANPTLIATLDGVPANRKHLLHNPNRIGKTSLWSMVNHVFASRRILTGESIMTPDP